MLLSKIWLRDKEPETILYVEAQSNRCPELSASISPQTSSINLLHVSFLHSAGCDRLHHTSVLPPPTILPSIWLFIHLDVSKLSDGNNQATAAPLNDQGELGPVPDTQRAKGNSAGAQCFPLQDH